MPWALLSVCLFVTIAMSAWPWTLFTRARADDTRYRLLVRECLAFWERAGQKPIGSLDARRDFERAATYFRVLCAAQRYKNSASCLLLGHAEYRSGNLAAAVFAYRTGLGSAPADKRLRRSLEFARSQVDYPSGSVGRPPPPSAWISPRALADALLVLALLLHVAASLSGTFFVMTWRRGWARLGVACFAGALLAGLLSFACAEQFRNQERFPLAVVQADRVPFRQGNGPSYPLHAEAPYLSRGMEARTVCIRGGWIQLELPGGHMGWVRWEKVMVEFFPIP